MHKDPELYRQQLIGEPEQLTETYNISYFSSCREETLDEVPSPQNPRFGNFLQENDLDQKQKKTLRSIIRKFKSTMMNKEFIEKSLRSLEPDMEDQQQELLPKILGKLRTVDDNPLQCLLRLEGKAQQQILDPEQFGTKQELKVYRKKLSESHQNFEELKLKAQSLEGKVIQLQNELEAEREKTVKLELVCNKINQSQSREDIFVEAKQKFEDDIRLKSEEWQIEKNNLNEYYNKQIQELNLICQKLREEKETTVRKLKDALENQKIKNDRLQIEAGLMQENLKQLQKGKEEEQQVAFRSKLFLEEALQQKETLMKKVIDLNKQLEQTRVFHQEKSQLESKAFSLENTIVDLNSLNARLENELQQEKNKNYQTKVFETSIFQFQVIQTDLRKQLQIKQLELQQKNTLYQSAKEECDNLTNKLQSSKQRIKKLKGQKQKLRQDFEKKQEQTSSLYDQLIQYQSQELNLHEQMDSMRYQIEQDLTKSVIMRRQETQTHAQQTNRLEQVIEEKQSEIIELRHQLQMERTDHENKRKYLKQQLQLATSTHENNHEEDKQDNNLEQCFDILKSYRATATNAQLFKIREKISYILSKK